MMVSKPDLESGVPLLEFSAVSHAYADGTRALNDCTLAIYPGSRNIVIGPNGSGKTTLFHHANGLLRPGSGVVRYQGQVVDYGRATLRHLRSGVGLVFQNPDRQLVSASVREDVCFGPLNLGLDSHTVRERVDQALRLVGMEDMAERLVHTLSFGQKKRVCIAGILAMQPKLLILDEPMAGLDHSMQEQLMAVLETLSGQGITLLMASHDMDFAYRWADQIHVMSKGSCVASLTSEALPMHTDVLASVGLVEPQVIGMHKVLQKRGVLPADMACPRSVCELTRLLASP